MQAVLSFPPCNHISACCDPLSLCNPTVSFLPTKRAKGYTGLIGPCHFAKDF